MRPPCLAGHLDGDPGRLRRRGRRGDDGRPLQQGSAPRPGAPRRLRPWGGDRVRRADPRRCDPVPHALRHHQAGGCARPRRHPLRQAAGAPRHRAPAAHRPAWPAAEDAPRERRAPRGDAGVLPGRVERMAQHLPGRHALGAVGQHRAQGGRLHGPVRRVARLARRDGGRARVRRPGGPRDPADARPPGLDHGRRAVGRGRLRRGRRVRRRRRSGAPVPAVAADLPGVAEDRLRRTRLRGGHGDDRPPPRGPEAQGPRRDDGREHRLLPRAGPRAGAAGGPVRHAVGAPGDGAGAARLLGHPRSGRGARRFARAPVPSPC